MHYLSPSVPIRVRERGVVGCGAVGPFGVCGTKRMCEHRLGSGVEEALAKPARQPDVRREAILIGGLGWIVPWLAVGNGRTSPDCGGLCR